MFDSVRIASRHRIACPKEPLDLVFPNGAGKVESHANIINRAFIPAQLRPVSSRPMARRNTPAFTRCATSTPHGASIARRMAAWSCPSRKYKDASGTPRIR